MSKKRKAREAILHGLKCELRRNGIEMFVGPGTARGFIRSWQMAEKPEHRCYPDCAVFREVLPKPKRRKP